MAFQPIYAIRDRHRRGTLLPYKQGIDDGSTLTLDFTKGQLDPRLTFTRSTNATFINSSGLVQWAANNMVIRSQDYTNAAWSKFRIDTTSSGLNVANTTLAPDGSNTGLLLKADAATGTHRVLQSNGTTGSTFLSNNGFTIITLSAFFKANGSNFAALKISNNIESRGVTRTFNLTDGVVSGIEDATWVCTNASATSVGNGWYRCQITASISRVDANDDQLGMWLFVANGAGTTDRSFTNSSASVWAWGAQAELASSAGGYNATTTATYQAPRFDHDPTTLAPRGLLIEGSAVNAALNSDVMRGTGWAVTNLLTPSNAAGVTDPANGTNSTNYIANGTTGYHFSGVVSTTTGALTTAVTWSCWVRANGYTKVLMAEGNSGRGAVSFDIDPNNATPPAPTVVGGAGSPTGTITRYPNNWYRIAMRVGVASSTAYQWNVVGYPTGATLGNFGAQYTGDSTNGIYVWGAQLEDGSGASSYIPTGASQGSRAYDHCYATGANFTSWFSVGAGTMVVVSDNIKNNSQNLAATISDDSLNNYVRMGFKVGGAANEYMLTTVGGSGSFQGSVDSGYAPPLNTVYRMAYAWDTNNFGIVANGGAVVTDSSGTLAGAGVLTRLVVGGDFVAVPNDIYFKNGHIRSLKYWPYRLPNAQLQSLTT